MQKNYEILRKKHTESVSKIIPGLSKQGAFFRAHIKTQTKNLFSIRFIRRSHTQKNAVKMRFNPGFPVHRSIVGYYASDLYAFFCYQLNHPV